MSQCMEALEKAQEVKSAQAKVRRSITAEGPSRAVDLLRDPDEITGSMRLDRFLRAMPRYGPDRSRRLLVAAGMHPGRLARRIRELTDDERERLGRAIAR
jgi:hypothetical protein